MSGPIRLDLSKSVTLDASGNGTVEFNGTYGDRWSVTRVAVRTSSAATVAQVPVASLYRRSVQPSNLVGATYTGNLDTWDGLEQFVDGEALIVQWIGGEPGATATATVGGTYTVDGAP